MFLVLILLLLGAAFPAAAQPTLSPSAPVKLEADRVEFLQDQGLVLATGRVHIQQEGVHLYADSIRYDMASQEVRAEGHVAWQQDTQEVQAESLHYNLATKRGVAQNVRTTTPPWFYRGTDVILEPDRIKLSGARFTTCDYPPNYEHYHLRAKSITVKPGRSFSARHVVLYMGKIPVFYIPFLGRDLRDRRMPFQFDTGSTPYLGRYALITSNYLFSPVQYGSVYVDGFQKRGLGLGVRHEMELNDYSVLSLYAYSAYDRGLKRARWEGMARGRWAVSSRLNGRLEALAPGDGWFSQEFSPARREPSLVSGIRDLSTSLTWSPRLFSLGVLLKRQDMSSLDPARMREFHKYLQTFPQVDLSLRPIPLFGRKGPSLNSRGSFHHQWIGTGNYTRTGGSLDLGLSQTMNVVRGHTLFAEAGLGGVFRGPADPNDPAPTIPGGFASTRATWTGRWMRSLTTSLGHDYSRKLGRLTDAEVPTHGVARNIAQISMEWNWNSRLVSRTTTTYDFRGRVEQASKRFSFLQEQLTLIPSKSFEWMTLANYSVTAHKLKDLNQVATLRSPSDTWRLRLGLSYVDPRVTPLGLDPALGARTLDLTSELALVVFTNYRISVLETYDVAGARPRTRQGNLYRDLHDWEAQLSYSQSEGGQKQAFFRLNLKAFPGRPLTVSESEIKRYTGANASDLIESTARQF